MNLRELVNKQREEIIMKNYLAAVEQLKSLIDDQPFGETFTITAGCPSERMAKEVAKRFNKNEVKAIVNQSRGWNILVTCPLANNLNTDL